MSLLEQTKELCRLNNIKPARSKGQNFLVEEEIYDHIAAAADLRPDDVVLEVGPGLGFLTAKLSAKVKKVVAVELDDKLAEALRARLQALEIRNVEVLNEDVLKIQPPLIPPCQGGGYKIVANLPYNITSIFLRKFLGSETKPELMALMLQKEVAERICARAGNMSLLAVSVQFYARPEIAEIVKKENFWPQPEVDSAIVKIRPHKTPLAPLVRGVNREREFFQLVKFGFSAKRKMLKNNLSAGLKISQSEVKDKIKLAGFNEKIRAQELSVDDWLKLFSVFGSKML